MTLIPMTKATGLGALPALLEDREGLPALRRVFEASAVPLAVIDERQIAVPLKAMCDMFEDSARATGDRLFGLAAGADMNHADFGRWLQYSAQARTLAEGLQRVERTAWTQQSGGQLFVRSNGTLASWSYRRPDGLATGPHHSDHLLFPMLRVLRLFLGADWTPIWLDLDYARDRHAAFVEQALPFRLQFGQDLITWWFPAEELQCRRISTLPDSGPVLTYADVHVSALSADQMEPVNSVQQIVLMRLLDGHTDIDGAARQCGVGVQRLQRMLRQGGMTYRDIVNRAVLTRARGLLAESNLPITDIALSLGYTDHANFTRAFRRQMRMSPSAFRKLKRH